MIKNHINAGQIRAARALLNWSQEDLAAASNLSIATIRKIEAGHISPRGKTIESIIGAFNDARIEFLAPSGVNLLKNEIVVINGAEANLELLEDISKTLYSRGGEVLIWNADNQVPEKEIIDAELLLRKNGIRLRFLVAEEDTHLHYPLEEYRWLPCKFYTNNIQLVYGNKVALSVRKDATTRQLEEVVIIESVLAAEAMRNAFNFMWDNCRKPSHSTAPTIYK